MTISFLLTILQYHWLCFRELLLGWHRAADALWVSSSPPEHHAEDRNPSSGTPPTCLTAHHVLPPPPTLKEAVTDKNLMTSKSQIHLCEHSLKILVYNGLINKHELNNIFLSTCTCIRDKKDYLPVNVIIISSKLIKQIFKNRHLMIDLSHTFIQTDL